MVAPVSAVPALNPVTAQIPGYALAQLQAQRRLALAQAMTDQAMSPIEYDNRGHISWTQGLAKALSAYAGQSMFDKAAGQQADLQTQAAQGYARAIGMGQQGQDASAPQPGAGGVTPQALGAALNPRASAALAQGAQQGSIGPTLDNAARMDAMPPAPPVAAPAAAPAMAPAAPLNPMNLPAELVWAASQGDPAAQEQLKTLLANRQTTTEQKNWAAQGVDPTQLAGGTVLAGQRAGMTDIEKLQDAARRAGPGSQEAAQLQDAISKANYLAPIDAKPGTPLIDPRTGKPTFFAPKTADGIGLNFTDPLHPTAYALPGYAGANAGIAGAEQGAKQANTVFTGVQGSNGATMSGFGGQLFGGGGGGSGGAPAAVPQPGPGPGPAPVRPVAAPPQPQRSGVITGQTPTDAAIAKNGADVIATAPQQVQQSRGAITGLQQALNIVESGIKTGAGTGKSMNMLALVNNLGIPLEKGDVDGYQTMQKYLQNSLNGAAANTSAGGSDARFESFMHGQPNAETMNGPALASAIRYVLAQHDATVARGNFLTAAYADAQRKGDPNPAQTAQTQWSSVYNPEYFRIGRLAAPEQLAAVNAMSKEQAQHFMQWRQAMGAFQ